MKKGQDVQVSRRVQLHDDDEPWLTVIGNYGKRGAMKMSLQVSQRDVRGAGTQVKQQRVHISLGPFGGSLLTL